MMTNAIISSCGTYCYQLLRVWDNKLPLLGWVMQNPSTADANVDDPTIRRCIRFARTFGYGGIQVMNIFALRATDESELLKHPDPFGPDNRLHLDRRLPLLGGAPNTTVVAWGNRLKGLNHHYNNAASLLEGISMHCLGTNKSGEPKHPLYLAKKTILIPWSSCG